MASSFAVSLFVILLWAVVYHARSLDYSDLEDMGVACPKRDRCRGYKNDAFYLNRNCECDSDCHTYQDCCIDVRRRTSAQRTSNVICLNYGEKLHAGIYAVSKCSRNWNGPKEVKQKCEGPLDISDPVNAAPVTSTSKSVTYKNRYCAECNDADTNSQKIFNSRVSCPEVNGLTQDKIMDELSYNKRKKKWGLNGKSGFKECEILFDIPDELNRSVRFCRANIVSKCARDWTRPQVKKACDEYMAVVYDKNKAYKNPHCAICNHVRTPDMNCNTDLSGKTKNFPLSKLVDINDSSNKTPECPSKQLYDPYFKKCRELSCAVPGYIVENGKCVPGG